MLLRALSRVPSLSARSTSPSSLSCASSSRARWTPLLSRSSSPWRASFSTSPAAVVNAGVDLGTTHACIAVMDGKEVRVVENLEGERTTPSILSLADPEVPLVGNTARKQLSSQPKTTYNLSKLLLGKPYEEGLAKKIGVKYKIVKGPEDMAAVEVAGKTVEIEALQKNIFTFMKETVESHSGEPLHGVALTVPSSFSPEERAALTKVAKESGVDNVNLVEEPLAAVFAYDLQRKARGKLVGVFDMGGRATTFSVVKLAEESIVAPTVLGFRHLDDVGGNNIDKKLFQHFIDHFNEREGIDLSGDTSAVQKLRDTAERVKNELSTSLTSDINLPYIASDATGPKHMQLQVSRSELEMFSKEVVSQATEAMTSLLEELELSKKDLNQVIVAGGVAKMPHLKQVLQDYFSQPPLDEISPDEVFTVGATLSLGLRLGSAGDKVDAFETLPLNIGIVGTGGIVNQMISSGTQLPAKSEMILSTSADGQTSIDILVVQGVRPFKDHCLPVYTLPVNGLYPLPAGDARVKVTISVDVYGQISMEAVSLLTQPLPEPEVKEKDTTVAEGEGGDAVDEEEEEEILDPTFTQGEVYNFGGLEDSEIAPLFTAAVDKYDEDIESLKKLYHHHDLLPAHTELRRLFNVYKKELSDVGIKEGNACLDTLYTRLAGGTTSSPEKAVARARETIESLIANEAPSFPKLREVEH